MAMALFVLASLSVVIFLYYQNQQLKNILTTYQSATPTPKATNDPTANWKTFTDSKYGYSVKYPPQGIYRINCEGEQDLFYLIKSAQTDLLEPQNCARDSRFNLEIVVLTKQPTIDDRYLATSSAYTVGGIEATKTIYTQKPNFEGPGASWYTEVNFKKGNYYYQAYTGDKDLEQTLDQILSTFKFIEAAKSPSPTPISSPTPSSQLPQY